jgi:hypothetical protein
MAYDDSGEYTPDADVAGMYEPTPDVPFMGNADGSDSFDFGVAMVTSALSGGGDGQADIYGTSAPGAGLAAESGGIASSLGSNWLSETFGKAMKWYEKQGDHTKAGINTMAGSFIKGLFSYNDEQRKIKALEKSSDATMLNAQTNASATERKFDNASAIGKTNFGAKPKGLIFSNKLAGRQARAGYGG